jgi:hypothetical protein
MNRFVIGLLLTFAFLVGCLAATMAAQVATPNAKAGTISEKWRYKCFRSVALGGYADEIEANLIKFGLQDWELASMTSHGNAVIYCMKHKSLE